MKKNVIARILAVVLSVLQVCAVAGCGNQLPQQTDGGNGDVSIASPDGFLVLSADAVFQIVYDGEGLAMKVTGMNSRGASVCEGYADYEGKDCATVVTELIRASAAAGCLSESVKNVVIKQAMGSGQPGDSFLEDIAAEAQSASDAAGGTAKVVLISKEQLNENGYIGAESAKTLLLNALGVEAFDEYYGGDAPQDGTYTCSVVVDGKKTHYSIDANTGIVVEVTEEELLELEADHEEGGEGEEGEETGAQNTWVESGETAVIPASGAGSVDLNVVSFNIRAIMSSDKGARSWVMRAIPLSQYLVELDADILCLQESASNKQYTFLKESIGDVYDFYHGSNGKGGGGVIGLRRETFRVLKEEIFWLSETPEVPSIGWDAKHPRVCHNLLLEHKQTGAKINLFNTHLDHVGVIAPTRGMELIMERIQQSTVPCILAGDFNQTMYSDAYKMATAVLQDTQKVAPISDSGSTYTYWGQFGDYDNLPIDFCMVSRTNMTPLSFRICRERWGGGNLYSDHYAVQAIVRLHY